MAHALVLYWLALATRYTPPDAIIDLPIQVDFIVRERKAAPESQKTADAQSTSNANRPAIRPTERKEPVKQAATEPSSALTLTIVLVATTL